MKKHPRQKASTLPQPWCTFNVLHSANLVELCFTVRHQTICDCDETSRYPSRLWALFRPLTVKLKLTQEAWNIPWATHLDIPSSQAYRHSAKSLMICMANAMVNAKLQMRVQRHRANMLRQATLSLALMSEVNPEHSDQGFELCMQVSHWGRPIQD